MTEGPPWDGTGVPPTTLAPAKKKATKKKAVDPAPAPDATSTPTEE